MNLEFTATPSVEGATINNAVNSHIKKDLAILDELCQSFNKSKRIKTNLSNASQDSTNEHDSIIGSSFEKDKPISASLPLQPSPFKNNPFIKLPNSQKTTPSKSLDAFKSFDRVREFLEKEEEKERKLEELKQHAVYDSYGKDISTQEKLMML